MEIKILSCLTKVFPNEICGCEVDEISCLKNETASFQIAVRADINTVVKVECNDRNAEFYSQMFVPVNLAAPKEHDDFFLRNAKSGNYPDVLTKFNGNLQLNQQEWKAVFVEYKTDETGTHNLEIKINDELISLNIIVYQSQLKKQTLICTHWFHSDCLSTYYNVEVFSDRYWEIVKSFMLCASNHGINAILTPIFTPPIDTQQGGERPTVQLIDVAVDKNNNYSFNFDKLKKWIKTAQDCGIEYFEFSHFFTQWGASHTPKIMAETPNGYKRIFGWETKADGKYYKKFLKQLAPELIKFIDKANIGNNCIFHTSDEPNIKHYFKYRKASKIMNKLFGDFLIADAMSDFTFYKNGLVKQPIPSIENIDKFYGKVPELWTYFCCSPYKENLPNRFIAMPLIRTRILGFIMYKYNVKGFLHWGYNFYYTQYSKEQINPFKVTDAGGAFSSGDAFVVYPADDGTPYPSIRLKTFHDAINDYEALKLLENKIGRNKVVEILEKDLYKPITVRIYPKDEKWLIEKRNEINKLLDYYEI